MDNAAIEEMFEGLGPVTIKRMFGGKGIYHQGLIIAIDLRDEIMLKADATSAPAFEQAGARQWAYEGKKGKPVLMPYWSVPDEALDDPDEMRKWVVLAFEAATRAQSVSNRKS
jgi:DNA transformation protein